MFGLNSQSRLAASATLGAFCLFSSLASAQVCPADDAAEPNDTCATSLPIAASPVIDLAVTDVSDDFWTITVPANSTCTLDVLFLQINVDIDVFVWDQNCTTQIQVGSSITDNEQVVWSNNTPGPVTYTVEINNFVQAVCGDYAMVYSFAPSTDPCAMIPDDTLEENDSCLTPATVSAGVVGTGLFVSKTDEDYYAITVPANMNLQVDATFVGANGDIEVDVYDDPACVNLVGLGASVGDNESVSVDNLQPFPVTFTIRVYLFFGDAADCNNYDLSLTLGAPLCSGPDDSFEENDTCVTASPITTGLTTGLFVGKQFVETDFYSIDVPDGATITVDAIFPVSTGDIDLELYTDCASFNNAMPVDEGFSVTDDEQVTHTNVSGATVNYIFHVFIWQGDPNNCQDYDLMVDVSGGGMPNLIPYCFGDGSGTPCPCGNNSTAGHAGGCANSAGNGAILTATGDPSVAGDTLNLDLSSASQNSFALLVSGLNQLPQMGGCIGCGLQAFDGLRCAGGGFLRHGSRATNSNGETGNGWGPPGGPPGGLIAFNGFAAGETRNFFAFYRDDTALVCQTGQNSSNGISVTFQP